MSEQENGIDFEALAAWGSKIKGDVAEAITTPRLSLAQLSDASGAPMSTLRNWVDKPLFRFDADQKRSGGKHRRFSDLDAVKVCLAHALVEQGVAASNAAAASEVISGEVVRFFGPKASAGSGRFFIDMTASPPAVSSAFALDQSATVAVNLGPIIRRVLALSGEELFVVRPGEAPRAWEGSDSDCPPSGADPDGGGGDE